MRVTLCATIILATVKAVLISLNPYLSLLEIKASAGAFPVCSLVVTKSN